MGYRFLNIDYTKGILTIGMIFGHVILILGNGQSSLLKIVISLLGPVTYSGFLFCFGFVVWISYLNRKSIPWRSVLKTALKCYLAFILSGLAWEILGAGHKPDWNFLASLSLIRVIPSYSEFLLSFSLMTIIAAAFASVIEISIHNKANLAIATMVFLMSTQLPKEVVYDPFVALIIGGKGYYFPICQYMPLFLFGAYLAKWDHDYNIAAAVISLIVVAIYGGLISANIAVCRFPPSTMWILASMASVYIYFGFGRFVEAFFPNILKHYLGAVGQHVLYYLLVSNIIIFTGVTLGFKETLNALHALIFYIGLMVVLFCFQCLTMDLNQARTAAKSRSQKEESKSVGASGMRQ